MIPTWLLVTMTGIVCFIFGFLVAAVLSERSSSSFIIAEKKEEK